MMLLLNCKQRDTCAQRSCRNRSQPRSFEVTLWL
jgi:hypothetical protein